MTLVDCPCCLGKGGFMAPTPECPADVLNPCPYCDGQAQVTPAEAEEIEALMLKHELESV
jgi:hypothetical protein